MLKTITWKNGTLTLLDQLKLPHVIKGVPCRTVKDTGEAIKKMQVRGAPAIVVSAAYGMAQAAQASKARDSAGLIKDLEKAGSYLKGTRPTAVNLAWAVDRILGVARHERQRRAESLKKRVEEEAQAIEAEDIALCAAMAEHGSQLFKKGDQVLTHCNTGS